MTAELAGATEYYGPGHIKEDVRQASLHAGVAGAMVTNLHMAGMPDRAEIWEAEQDVWMQRRDELVQTAQPGRKWLIEYASKVTSASFSLNLVDIAR